MLVFVCICWYLLIFCMSSLICVDICWNLLEISWSCGYLSTLTCICWYLLLFAALGRSLLIFANMSWCIVDFRLYLLIFINMCCYFVDICWSSLVSIDICWHLLIFVVIRFNLRILMIFVHIWFCLLTFVEFCWDCWCLKQFVVYMLIFVDRFWYFVDKCKYL